ncbi:MAG: 4-alpha-glucanotransferase [Clostridia bacterium]|nr:4-alpha-glucanotransferase [Clostridia bacterium]
MKRQAGVLMPIISLSSEYGIGCFSKEAYEFIDFLKEAKQSFWQILPLGPTGFGDSPYQSFSSFAGNPYLISLDDLAEEELLTKNECRECDFGADEEKIDYGKLYSERYPLLKKAFMRSSFKESEAYMDFEKNSEYWLDDYALFMAIKGYFGGDAVQNWEINIRMRDEKSIDKFKNMLKEEIDFQKFLQYKFYSQWKKLKKYANENGIKIIGDIPIYTATDSADVWAQPELFLLDEKLSPSHVAGCPPDGFSKEGQLWGNPVYNWENHKKNGFSWWIKRLEHCFKMYDVVRIDHFRGFDEFYMIPSKEKTAVNGKWVKAPGKELFGAIEKALGKREIIAEDLGFITESVKDLLEFTNFPGMKVLEFAFDSRSSDENNTHLPHNYPENSVCYSATHDNSTLKGWFKAIPDECKKKAREYLCDFYTPDDKLNFPFISVLMRSASYICIIPMQDYLCLEDCARINTPSTTGKNWQWRIKKGGLNSHLANEIKLLTKRYSR